MDDEPNGIPDVGTTGVKRPAQDTIHNPQHKKFKTSELPLTAAQHAAIETLLYAVKKKGVFDHVRKTIWAEFNESVGLWRAFPLVFHGSRFADGLTLYCLRRQKMHSPAR